jgi:hypothetical protein
VTYVGVTAVFTPSSALAYSTTYTATITTGAKDLAGNALTGNKVWSFTAGAAPDITTPTVSSTIPAAATGVAVNSAVAATFSESMNPLTITTATFTLKQGVTPVLGAVTYVGVTAVFTPSSALAYSTTYTATITTGAKDLAGNALASNYVWSFTTTGATINQAALSSTAKTVNQRTGEAQTSFARGTSVKFTFVLDTTTGSTSTVWRITLQQPDLSVYNIVSTTASIDTNPNTLAYTQMLPAGVQTGTWTATIQIFAPDGVTPLAVTTVTFTAT